MEKVVIALQSDSCVRSAVFDLNGLINGNNVFSIGDDLERNLRNNYLNYLP